MKKYSFSVVSQTLIMSAAFEKAMIENRESVENKLYMRLREDFPNLIVKRATHATPKHYNNSDGTKTTRNKHNDLTYKRMERFLNALPNGAEYLEAYKKNRSIAEAICASPYSAVSAWFMKQFPEFRSNPLFYLDNSPKIIDFSTVLAKSKAKETPSVNEAEGQVKKDA